MYARVTTIQGSPDKMDDAKGHVQEQTLPQLQEMEGFKGFVALGDRQSGTVLGVAFWESEEALRATEEAVSSVRGGVAERRRASEGRATSTDARAGTQNPGPSSCPIHPTS